MLEKKKEKNKHQRDLKCLFFRQIRFFTYIFINFFLIFLIKKLILYTKFINYLFLVYPASEKELEYYWHKWYKKLAPNISIIGMIWDKNSKKRGIIITIPFLLEDIDGNYKKLKSIIDDATRFADETKIQIIALAGQLPSLFLKNQIKLEKPFVKGDLGTVFSITESISEIIRVKGLANEKLKVGVVGIGFIGRKLAKDLVCMGFNMVIGIDDNKNKINQPITGVRLSDSPELLKICDIVIILTSRGDDILNKKDYFKCGVIIIDDTYPAILKETVGLICQELNAEIYRTMIIGDSTKFVPSFPRFKNNWLPGCVIEAIVVSVFGREVLLLPEKFSQNAKSISLKPLIVKCY